MKNTSCSQGKSNFGTFWVVLLSFLVLSLLVQSCRLNQNVLVQAASMNQRGQGETNQLNLPDREGADKPSFKSSIPQSAIKNLSSTSIGDPQSKAEVIRKTAKLQMPFIANNGQTDERVKFYANTFGGTVFVTKDGEIVYALPNNEKADTKSQHSKDRSQNAGRGGVIPPLQESDARIQNCRGKLHSPSGLSPLKRGDQGVCNTTPIPNDKNETHTRPLPYRSMGQALLEGRTGVALREEFVGAKVKAIQGEEKSVTKVNYFKSNDSSKWKSNISTYDVVNLGEIYKGIELKLKAYGNNVEKLFCVKPDANPEQIKISLSGIQPSENPPPLSPSVRGTGGCPPLAGAGGGLGARGLWVNDEGQLVAETELGAVKFTKPVAYQEINGRRVDVECKYTIADCEIQNADCKTNLKSETQNLSSTSIGDPQLAYGFTVASYDKTKDLIIDPLLASTFLGGYSSDYGYSMAIDSDGNIYVAGQTGSSDFPTTTGTYQTSYKGYNSDAFIAKLNGDLTNLLTSTYLGGYDYYDEVVYSIVIDSSNNVYVTGLTKSSDFPTTTGAYDTSFNSSDSGLYDTFISKLNGDLTSLLASTYIGGSRNDRGGSIVTDSSGNIYVAGYTGSSDFPTTTGAYDISHNGNDWDVYISKLDGNLTSLIASTYLGGDSGGGGYSSGYYNPIDMAMDSNGDIYVAGKTNSSTFPTTADAYDISYNGGHDVFVSKLNGTLTNLTASTFLGGTGDDQYIQSIAIDSEGNIYVTGFTSSSDFPTTTGAYDTSYGGAGGDIFISKLKGDLSSLLASTYLGGSDADNAYSIAIDSSGNIYLGGYTWSSTFPISTGAYNTSYGGYGDAFISKLNGELTNLLASTYLGGASYDYGYSIAINSSGSIYISGYTSSSDFPTTVDAYQNNYKTHSEAFVSKFDSNLSGPPPSGSVSINNNSGYTNTTYVTLNLSATDDTGIVGYYISTNSSTPSASDSNWTSVTSTTSYNENVSYTLSSDDGNKTVYAWFKDASGNISSTASDSIILDTTIPTITINSPTSDDTYTTTSNVIAIGGTASDTTSGINSITWANDKGGSGTASGITSWLTSSISLLSGENIITVTATDGAGNTSTDKITVIYNTGTVSTPTPTLTPVTSPTPILTPTTEPSEKGIISGYVINAREYPIESAKIRLKGVNSKILKKTSDEDGLFEFTDLDADTYVITAIKKGYKTVKQTITLEAGEEKDIEIVMKRTTKKGIYSEN